MVNRRTALLRFLGGLAGGSLLTSDAFASVQLRETFGSNHYNTVIEKARGVLVLSEQRKAILAIRSDEDSPELPGDGRRRELLIATTTAVDDLLGYMLANFQGDISVEDVRGILAQRSSINTLEEAKLVEIADGLVPITIMRELLHRHKVSFIGNRCEHWETFVDRYKEFLVPETSAV